MVQKLKKTLKYKKKTKKTKKKKYRYKKTKNKKYRYKKNKSLNLYHKGGIDKKYISIITSTGLAIIGGIFSKYTDNKISRAPKNIWNRMFKKNILSKLYVNSEGRIILKDEKSGEIEYRYAPNPTISKGSFGTVYKIISTGGPELAMKVSKDNWKGDNEPEIVKQINNTNFNNCDLINARVLEGVEIPFLYRKEEVIVMEIASGDLLHLFFELNKENILTEHIVCDIIYKCTEIIECIFNNGIGYIDIKPQNFLYLGRYRSPDFKIVLGDLGSFCGKYGELNTIGSSFFYQTRFIQEDRDYSPVSCDFNKPEDKEKLKKIMIFCLSICFVWGLNIYLKNLIMLNVEQMVGSTIGILSVGLSSRGGVTDMETFIDILSKIQEELRNKGVHENIIKLIGDMFKGDVTFSEIKTKLTSRDLGAR